MASRRGMDAWRNATPETRARVMENLMGGNADTLVITLPLPSPLLSPNARTHWAVKSREAKPARNMAAWAAKAALHANRHIAHLFPATTATVEYAFYWPDRRRRDDDNAIISCKSYRDGLADGGLLVDDCGVTLLPARFEVDKDRPRLEIRVTPTAVDSDCGG